MVVVPVVVSLSMVVTLGKRQSVVELVVLLVNNVGCIGIGLYTIGLGFQSNGVNQRERSGPICRRGTTLPLPSNHCVKVVRGFRPILTPIQLRVLF